MFDRTISLVGEENFNKIKEKTVLVVGLGGVGGYATEALVRSVIHNLILIDHDTIDITNLNRQIIALNSTIGVEKVLIMKNRIKDINAKINVKYVVIIGEEEFKANKVTLKNMLTGEQKLVNLENLINEIL